MTTGATEQDKKLKQYLEDERIALFLQNEEFMRELQRNREFLIALERGTTVHSTHYSQRHSAQQEVCVNSCTVFNIVIYIGYASQEIMHRK